MRFSSAPSRRFRARCSSIISGEFVPKWLQLTEMVKTGKPAMEVNDQSQGAKFFEQLVVDIFPMSYPAAQALADHLKVASSTKPVKVLDIASGSGVWGIGLAQKSKNVQVIGRRLAGRHSGHEADHAKARRGKSIQLHRRRHQRGESRQRI